MPKELNIFIIIMSSLIGLYLLFLIVVIILISSFNKSLAKRQLALVLIFQQRKDVVLNFYESVKKDKIQFDDEIKKDMKKLLKNDGKIINENQLLLNLTELEKLSLDIINFLKAQKSFKKKEEFLVFQKEIEELDESKRQNISIYNHDVEGYNYWVRFLAYRYLFVLFKIKQKNRLE